MKNHVALLSLAVALAFAGTQAGASTVVSTSAGTKKSPESTAQVLKNAPTVSLDVPVHKSRLFPVNDEKGLLLTCIAPDIDTNANTDLFEDCKLAPGRTLNDVMHSFVGAMHSEESQRAQERAEWTKALEEKSAQAGSQK
jgi:hypothetical protein